MKCFQCLQSQSELLFHSSDHSIVFFHSSEKNKDILKYLKCSLSLWENLGTHLVFMFFVVSCRDNVYFAHTHKYNLVSTRNI